MWQGQKQNLQCKTHHRRPYFLIPSLPFTPFRVPFTVASNLVQANIHSGSVLHYPGRLVAHRGGGNRAAGNQGLRTVEATVVEEISAVAAVEIQGHRKGGSGGGVGSEDVILVDQQRPEDATETDVTCLSAGVDSDQRLLLGSGGGATKEGSVGRRTGSKQKKISIRNATASGGVAASNGGGMEEKKEKPMITIVTIGGRESAPDGSEEGDEDKIDILAHL